MFKKLLLACAIALPLGASRGIPSAMADDVDIYLGVPSYGYGYQVRPRYRHYEGYRHYDGHRYPRYRRSYYDYDDDGYSRKLSCREARRRVRAHGFHGIETRECAGRNYTFSGFRNGRYAIIHVNSYTGRVWRN
jgi:hypothetical protein